MVTSNRIVPLAGAFHPRKSESSFFPHHKAAPEAGLSAGPRLLCWSNNTASDNFTEVKTLGDFGSSRQVGIGVRRSSWGRKANRVKEVADEIGQQRGNLCA